MNHPDVILHLQHCRVGLPTALPHTFVGDLERGERNISRVKMSRSYQ